MRHLKRWSTMNEPIFLHVFHGLPGSPLCATCGIDVQRPGATPGLEQATNQPIPLTRTEMISMPETIIVSKEELRASRKEFRERPASERKLIRNMFLFWILDGPRRITIDIVSPRGRITILRRHVPHLISFLQTLYPQSHTQCEQGASQTSSACDSKRNGEPTPSPERLINGRRKRSECKNR